MKASLKTKTLIAAATAMTVSLSSIAVATAENVNNSVSPEELEVLKIQLIEARAAVESAQQVAEDIVNTAEMDAVRIRAGAGKTSEENSEDPLSPLVIKNAAVAVEIAAGTLEEIAIAIMPEDWRILVDVKDPKIKERRFQYVTTKSRDQALSDLLNSIGMNHQYFFELVNADGEPSPLLVISQR